VKPKFNHHVTQNSSLTAAVRNDARNVPEGENLSNFGILSIKEKEIRLQAKGKATRPGGPEQEQVL
jgi:hypothetical protein